MGRRQGGQPYITFGYHRRPPARTRAAARGRRPDLSAYAQQPARGPTMGAVAADVGVVVLAGTKTGYCGLLWLLWLLWFLLLLLLLLLLVLLLLSCCSG